MFSWLFTRMGWSRWYFQLGLGYIGIGGSKSGISKNHTFLKRRFSALLPVQTTLFADHPKITSFRQFNQQLEWFRMPETILSLMWIHSPIPSPFEKLAAFVVFLRKSTNCPNHTCWAVSFQNNRFSHTQLHNTYLWTVWTYHTLLDPHEWSKVFLAAIWH